MRQIPFRTEDEWKAALLTLPDNAYLNLMRSVLGNIKTPFTKHRLMEDLVSFLSRREILEIIAAYIDEADRRVIAAITLLEEPAPGELESFFSGEYSYLDIHRMLLNLEERLIVYRFREDGAYRLSLNPVLAPVLSPFVTDVSGLLPAFPVQPGTEEIPAPDDRILAGLFAFLFAQGEFFRTDGRVRKKAADEGKRMFPSMDIERLIGGLYNISLFSSEGGRLNINTRRLTLFRDLSPLERREYWAGGIYSYCRDPDPIIRYPHWGRTQKLAQLVHRFIGSLKEGHVYPLSTLKRLVELLERSEAGNPRWGEVGMIPLSIGTEGADAFLKALETVGLIAPVCGSGVPSAGTAFLQRVPVPASEPGEAAGPVIAMDAPFSCILYPEVPFADALSLTAFCSIQEAGTAVRFELTKESVIRGFDFGLDAGAMIERLERLSRKPADQSLVWKLRDWETRYADVAVHQGTVLVLSESRRYLVTVEPIASLIARELGPGVYLLSCPGHSPVEMHEAVQSLRKAGVDIIATPPFPAESAPAGTWIYPPGEDGTDPVPQTAPARTSSPYPPLKNPPLVPVREGAAERSRPGPQEWVYAQAPAQTYQERFRQALRKLTLPKPEMDELSARINRRLIVSESQLVSGAVRNEKTEAHTLDYVGKYLLAKQAVARKSLVEIHWITPESESSRCMGVPPALEKRGGETILTLTTLPEGTEIRLPLGKISLLRLIKPSIFGE
ncbi:MAG: helicase-associated domain-containing protein [Spirochaetaceae bacterium]|jgi:hypothetical protein|nr:helicase-associated domain-containing protein [Spirochaetaceae bacterium]